MQIFTKPFKGVSITTIFRNSLTQVYAIKGQLQDHFQTLNIPYLQ